MLNRNSKIIVDFREFWEFHLYLMTDTADKEIYNIFDSFSIPLIL